MLVDIKCLVSYNKIIKSIKKYKNFQMKQFKHHQTTQKILGRYKE